MSNVIFSYTRNDAIQDGTFVDVTELAKQAGIKHPTAVTSNLFHKYIEPSEKDTLNGQDETGRLWDVLSMFAMCCRGMIGERDGNMAIFPVIFLKDGKHETVTLWAFVEAQGPDDPSPGINIMLPEDY